MRYLTNSQLEKLAAELQPHQERAIARLSKQDKLLLYHGLGSGKTLTALAAAEKYKSPLTVIGPAAIKHQFPKEKAKHGIETPVKAYSYAKPPEKENPKFLAYDEAHRMSNVESKRSKYVDKYKPGKQLLLTGTPIRNKPSDLIPVMRGLGIEIPRDRAKFNKAFIEEVENKPGLWARYIRGIKPGTTYKAKNLDVIKKALKGKVDYHASSTEHFPEVSKTRIAVEMSDRQQDAYDMAMKQNPSFAYKVKHGIAPSKAESSRMNAFLTATRQISNVPGQYNLSATAEDAPKINRALKEIKSRIAKDPNYKGVTYSQYIAHGVDPVAKRLEKNKIPYAKFTGKQTPKQKAQIIKDYNEGKIKQLLVSGAGAEGLDLKGTKLLQVLEPYWNDALLDQVRGRAVRYKSHAHLPKEERKVEIQNFIAVPKEKGFFRKKREGSTDTYLEMLSKDKKELNQQFLKVLQEVGSKQ